MVNSPCKEDSKKGHDTDYKGEPSRTPKQMMKRLEAELQKNKDPLEGKGRPKKNLLYNIRWYHCPQALHASTSSPTYFLRRSPNVSSLPVEGLRNRDLDTDTKKWIQWEKDGDQLPTTTASSSCNVPPLMASVPTNPDSLLLATDCYPDVGLAPSQPTKHLVKHRGTKMRMVDNGEIPEITIPATFLTPTCLNLALEESAFECFGGVGSTLRSAMESVIRSQLYVAETLLALNSWCNMTGSNSDEINGYYTKSKCMMKQMLALSKKKEKSASSIHESAGKKTGSPKEKFKDPPSSCHNEKSRKGKALEIEERGGERRNYTKEEPWRRYEKEPHREKRERRYEEFLHERRMYFDSPHKDDMEVPKRAPMDAFKCQIPLFAEDGDVESYQD
ncbi:hypothetical protein CR513_09544, partial [Mucuna pruriens]